MANRRITELQDIAGTALAEDDLFTVVHVGEVDPTLKNRKITLSGTKQYLSSYYLSKTGDTVSGALVIQGNLTVSGSTTFSAVTLTGALTVGSVLAQSGIVASGTISGATVTGTNIQGTNVNGVLGNFTTITGNVISVDSGNFLTKVSGATITGASGAFTSLTGQTITGTSGGFVTLNATAGNFTSITGVTISGTTVTATTGIFSTFTFTGATVSGDLNVGGSGFFSSGITVSGNLNVGGSGFFSSGISVTGTITGTTVATTTGSFVSLTGTTATFTSGIIASGTAALPSLAILSDPNTGLFSPGADQLAISTNGTGRLFVDASGRLLVGTSSSRASANGVEAGVQVEGIGAAGALSIIRNGGLSYLTLGRSGSSTIGSNTIISNGDELGRISWAAADGTDIESWAAQISAEIDGVPGGNDVPGRLIFSTTPDGNSSPTERMRIDSSGRLGLGTSSPGGKLHIALTSSATTPIVNVGSFGVDGVVTLGSIANNSEQVYLGTGDVNGGGIAAGIGFLREAAGWNSSLAFYTNNVTSGPNGVSAIQEKMRITSGGLVGIGTTSPGEKLAIVDSGVVYSSLTGQSTTLYSYASNTGCGFFTGSAQPITFGINSSEGMRLDSSKRLLVGTSTARINFYAGNATFTPAFQVERANSTNDRGTSFVYNANNVECPIVILGKSRGSSVNSFTAVQNGDLIGRLSFQGADGTNLVEGATVDAFVDGTPGSNDLPTALKFSTTADGASSPTERFRISSDGSFSSVIPGGSTLYPQFGCRAWVNFNGTGTVAIRASGNVSSITDNGTGNYTVNFTTALSDADYVGVFGCNDNGNITTMNYRTGGTKTTTAFQVSTVADGAALTDNNMAMVAVFR